MESLHKTLHSVISNNQWISIEMYTKTNVMLVSDFQIVSLQHSWSLISFFPDWYSIKTEYNLLDHNVMG